ncbi:hypothetical protein H0H81_007028 [Sphagnurus paluster]|uniref:RanBP2-type domain-containing protein n=1 Tax=Sphagnurus paluster TaxID=117069 RepID=A0A9P7FVG2_9AGAR|nr:hypothetical protein H0H81_007028 [Sphagnurus paluster]
MEEDPDESFASPGSPAASLNRRGHQMLQDRQIYQNDNQGSSTRAPPTPPQPQCNPSPPKNLETVSAHLRESLGNDGVEQLVSLLRKGQDEPEPFRFSSSPSTPARGNSPFPNNTNGPTFSFGASAAQITSPTPRKTLNRNPNGVYRWQGGGSAKAPRSRNRYSSPAFGPSRSAPDRLVLNDTPTATEPANDTKRRRIAEEVVTSSAVPSGSVTTSSNGAVPKPAPVVRAVAPDPSSTRVRQSLPFPVSAGSPTTPRTLTSTPNVSSQNVSTSPSTARLRIPPVQQKPTVPVVPSPLRQAWSGASPPSHPTKNDTSPATPPPKQTKAANFMTELIKEVTPPKRPDLSNPYQTANPVGKVGGPVKPRVGRRTRATGKPAAPTPKDDQEREKEEDSKTEKVYSPQAIIEATLPKGSKRSRPPSHFEKTSREPSPSSGMPTTEGESSTERKRSYVVEEVDDESEEPKRSPKKSKPFLVGKGTASVNGKSAKSSPDIVIEEVDDIVVDTPEKPQAVTSPPPGLAISSAPSRPLFGGLKAASAPKEPSKLRFSYQPEPISSPAPTPAPTLAPLPAPSPDLVPALAPTPLPVPAPPAFTFTPASTATPSPSAFALPKVTSTPVLPSFGFTAPTEKREIEQPKQATPRSAKEAALTAPAHSLPTYAFPTAMAGPSGTSQHAEAKSKAKSLDKSALPSFDFSKQALKSASSTAHSSVSAAPMKTFDWAAAGMKPVGEAGGTWTCSTCMLSNPATVTDKCTVCEAPKPEKVDPPVKSFDWTAAGIKPTGDGGSTWTCSTCMLSNPATATDKCTVCESPR